LARDRFSRRHKKKRTAQTIVLLIILLFSACLYLLIGGLGSDYLKLSFKGLLNPVPEFNHLIVEHNGTRKKLTSGQILQAHPYDSLKIVKIGTSVLFNRHIRLFCQGLDINALREKTVITNLLPGQDPFHHYTYSIVVKHRNDPIGEVGLIVSPSVEDWLVKADKIIDPKKRITFLTTAVKETRDKVQLRMRLADEYLALKKWKEAAAIIEDIIKEKKDVNLMMKLADAYENLRYYNSLIRTLGKILALTPENLDTRLRLAEVLEKKGRLKEAIKQYEMILPRLPQDEKVVAMKTIGYLSYQTGQKKEALQWYLKAAKYDKNDPNLYYNIGSIYDELKQPKQAEEYLRLAINLKQDDLEGRMRLAQSLFKEGKFKEAKRYLQEILKKDPRHQEALTLLAHTAEKQGDTKTLRSVYKRILSRDTKNTTILFNLGVMEADEGNLKEAVSYFKRVVKINPKDIQAREALFTIYQRQKRNDLAFVQAQTLIKLAPKKVSYYRFIFNYLVEQSKYEQVAQYMREAIKANPEKLELRKYLILAYLKLEKNELAAKELEKAIRLRPNDTELLHQLATLKEASGDLEPALALYKKILAISPDDEKAEEAYLRLRFKLLHKGK
jgi:tetratricopeptide (TPR) repeat protein